MVKDSKKKNGIVYNQSVREQLRRVHNSLSTDITDMAVGASTYAIEFTPNAKATLQQVSKLSSDLTIALLKAKGDRELSAQEKKDYAGVKELVDILGNVQFKMNDIIKKSDIINEVAKELVDDSYDLSKEIMKAQEKFRLVRQQINDYGAFSSDPRIAGMME